AGVGDTGDGQLLRAGVGHRDGLGPGRGADGLGGEEDLLLREVSDRGQHGRDLDLGDARRIGRDHRRRGAGPAAGPSSTCRTRTGAGTASAAPVETAAPATAGVARRVATAGSAVAAEAE